MKRFLICLIIILALNIFGNAFALNFNDVSEDSTYFEAVKYLCEAGIIKGDNNGSFNPNAFITRAEVAAMVSRLMGLEEVAKGQTEDSSFLDVSKEHWAIGYINLMQNKSVIKGFLDKTFKPDAFVIYEQAVKMLVAAIGYSDNDVKKYGEYPENYLSIANKEGIIKDVSVIKGENAPRYAVAVMAYNTYKKFLMPITPTVTMALASPTPMPITVTPIPEITQNSFSRMSFVAVSSVSRVLKNEEEQTKLIVLQNGTEGSIYVEDGANISILDTSNGSFVKASAGNIAKGSVVSYVKNISDRVTHLYILHSYSKGAAEGGIVQYLINKDTKNEVKLVYGYVRANKGSSLRLVKDDNDTSEGEFVFISKDAYVYEYNAQSGNLKQIAAADILADNTDYSVDKSAYGSFIFARIKDGIAENIISYKYK